ncbi:hypothetical protein BH09ACT7_BH09ACT7_46220 [soil metagenome]
MLMKRPSHLRRRIAGLHDWTLMVLTEMRHVDLADVLNRQNGAGPDAARVRSELDIIRARFPDHA